MGHLLGELRVNDDNLLHKGEDNAVQLRGLRNTDDPATFVDDGTLTFTLKDMDGDAVSGAENISMTYETDSDGVYVGLVQQSVSLTIHTHYFLEVSMSDGTDTGFRRRRLWCNYHRSRP